MLDVNRLFPVLRCSNTYLYVPLRCSKINDFRLNLANCKQALDSQARIKDNGREMEQSHENPLGKTIFSARVFNNK